MKPKKGLSRSGGGLFAGRASVPTSSAFKIHYKTRYIEEKRQQSITKPDYFDAGAQQTLENLVNQAVLKQNIAKTIRNTRFLEDRCSNTSYFKRKIFVKHKENQCLDDFSFGGYLGGI